MEVSLDYLITTVSKYNLKGLDKIRKAYDFAALAHKNQYRESGDPYITHPLAVSILLARINADVDTICAGLLHDVIEDTPTTKEDIEAYLGVSILGDIPNFNEGAKMYGGYYSHEKQPKKKKKKGQSRYAGN